MIDINTRVRVSEIANMLWKILRDRVLFFASTEDFTLTAHALDNNDPDSAIVDGVLEGNPEVTVRVRGVRWMLTVTAPDNIRLDIQYQVGGRSLGDTTVLDRRHSQVMDLQAFDNLQAVDFAKQVMVSALQRDLTILLNPGNATHNGAV